MASLMAFGAALLLGYAVGRVRPLWQAREAARWRSYSRRRRGWLFNLHVLLLVPDHLWRMRREDRRG